MVLFFFLYIAYRVIDNIENTIQNELNPSKSDINLTHIRQGERIENSYKRNGKSETITKKTERNT